MCENGRAAKSACRSSPSLGEGFPLPSTRFVMMRILKLPQEVFLRVTAAPPTRLSTNSSLQRSSFVAGSAHTPKVRFVCNFAPRISSSHLSSCASDDSCILKAQRTDILVSGLQIGARRRSCGLDRTTSHHAMCSISNDMTSQVLRIELMYSLRRPDR